MPSAAHRMPAPIRRYGAEIVSRASTAWDGFRLEMTTKRATGPCEFDFRAPEHTLSLFLGSVGEPPHVEIRFESGLSAKYLSHPGHINFIPAQQRARGLTRGVGTFRSACLFFEPSLVERATGGELERVGLVLAPAVNLMEPTIAQATGALVREAEQPGPLSHVYAERLASVILTALVRKHLLPDDRAAVSTCEAPRRVRRVLDHIEAHLDGDLSVFTLATEAGMSPAHLARQLKRLTGLSPHQYVLRRRVEAAKVLLAQHDWPLTEVALAVGFSNQAHLGSAFRRLCGLTPGAYRRLHQRHVYGALWSASMAPGA